MCPLCNIPFFGGAWGGMYGSAWHLVENLYNANTNLVFGNNT